MLMDFWLGNTNTDLFSLLVMAVFLLIAFVLAVTVHEYFHNLAKYKFGDTSVKDEKKLTLNPLKQLRLSNIAPFFMTLFFSFCWLKPTKSHFSKGKNAVVAVSGPLSNLVFAVAAILFYDIIYVISVHLYVSADIVSNIIIYFQSFLSSVVLVNLALFVFNILPLPGLDGGEAIAQLFKEDTAEKFLGLSKYTYIIYLFLIIFLSRAGIASLITSAIATAVETPILALFSILFEVNYAF